MAGSGPSGEKEVKWDGEVKVEGEKREGRAST